MTFEQFYGDDVKCTPQAFEFMKEKTYLLDLQQLIQAGRKLTVDDCEQFWTLFKEAQKSAFEAGQSK